MLKPKQFRWYMSTNRSINAKKYGEIKTNSVETMKMTLKRLNGYKDI